MIFRGSWKADKSPRKTSEPTADAPRLSFVVVTDDFARRKKREDATPHTFAATKGPRRRTLVAK
jgi:hypothetical protein